MFKKISRSAFFKRGIPFLLSFVVVFVASYVFVHAQGDGKSISGDEICGGTAATACSVKYLPIVSKRLLVYIVGLGLPLLIVFIAYRFVTAWFALRQGNANAYKEAIQKSMNATLGFFFIVALFGGLLFVMLKYLGVSSDGNNPSPLKILEMFKNALSEPLIGHAFAQTPTQQKYLPNYLPGVTSVYDFILVILRLVMRFFVYPGLIIIWVWTGFGFVAAQGNPGALAKAKQWLLWAFITTLVVFFIQTFLIAVRGTVDKILPGATSSLGNTVNGSPAGTQGPAPGTAGASCAMPDGSYGITDTTGACRSSARGQTGTSTTSGNQGPATGTAGAACTKTDGTYGVTDTTGACVSSSRGQTGTGAVTGNTVSQTCTANGGKYIAQGNYCEYTCPNGKKYYDQSDYRITCATMGPATPSPAQECTNNGGSPIYASGSFSKCEYTCADGVTKYYDQSDRTVVCANAKLPLGSACNTNDQCASGKCAFAGWSYRCLK